MGLVLIFFLFFVCCLLFLFVFVSNMALNNNFFNPNMNPYFTSISLSNSSNSALKNMNQLNNLDWMYLTQYNPYRLSDDQHFKNNFNSSQRVNGDSPPPSQIFNLLIHLVHLFHNFLNIHSLILLPILLF